MLTKQFQGLQGIVNEEFGRYLTQDEAFVCKHPTPILAV